MQVYSVILPTIIASLCATGCSLLLVRRGPSSRLRYLTLTVGLMSFAQTANLLHMQGVWTGGSLYVVHVHQSLVAGLSLLAMYLLAMEVYDRNFTDRRLRLAEHELLTMSAKQTTTAVQRWALAAQGVAVQAQPQTAVAAPQPFDLIALAAHVGFCRGLGMEREPERCEICLHTIHELGSAWQELYEARMERRAEGPALERLARVQRMRLQHETASGHAIIDLRSTHPRAVAAITASLA